MRLSPNCLTSGSARRAYVSGDGKCLFPLYMCVYQQDDGSPMIGLTISKGLEPFLSVWFDGQTVMKEFNQQALVYQYESLSLRIRGACTLEQFAAAAYHAPFTIHGVASHLTKEDWLNIVTGALPSAEDMVNSEEWTSMKSTRAREIANALGLSPKSVRKEDVLQAIFEHRRAYESTNPLHGSVDDATFPSIDVCKNETREPVFKMFQGGGDVDIFDLPQDIVDLIAPEATQNGRGWTGYLYDTTVTEGTKALAKLLDAGLNVTAAIQAHESLKTKAWFANQQVSSLRNEIENIQQKLDALEAKRLQLTSAIAASRPTQIPTAPGMVMVMGEDIPFFASPDAPSAIPNYSLSYWSASMRIGQGADEVKFNAVDFMHAVLSDPVVSLVGAPGTGKTTICRQSAHVMGVPCTIVQFTRDKPIEQLIGVDKIRSGAQVFIDGEITVAMRAAAAAPDVPYIIVFDEFDHAPSEVQSDFHGVVEGVDYTLPNGEIIKNNGNLRFVLTRNTSGHGDVSGRHASANISDSAFNSRIKSTFIVDYMDPINEQVLLTTYGLDVQESEQVVSFANATRRSVESVDAGESFDGMSEPVCLRHLIGYASTRARGVDKKKALAQCIIAALPHSDRRVANELIVSHISLD